MGVFLQKNEFRHSFVVPILSGQILHVGDLDNAAME
jgi:hypothetical protein